MKKVIKFAEGEQYVGGNFEGPNNVIVTTKGVYVFSDYDYDLSLKDEDVDSLNLTKGEPVFDGKTFVAERDEDNAN